MTFIFRYCEYKLWQKVLWHKTLCQFLRHYVLDIDGVDGIVD